MLVKTLISLFCLRAIGKSFMKTFRRENYEERNEIAFPKS